MALKDQPKTTRIHHALGTIAFIAFIVLVIIDAHPEYSVSIYLSGMIVISYLILLGFGAIITRLAEVKYE